MATVPKMATGTSSNSNLSIGAGKLRTSMLIYLIGGILGIIGSFAGVIPAVTGQSMAAGTSASLPTAYLALTIVAIIFAITALLFMRSGFKILKGINARYGIGVMGTTLEIIGGILVGIGVILLIGVVLAAYSASTTGSSAVGYGLSSIGILGLIGIGAIIAFVGVILTMVGFWRIGSDYNDGTIKVGAILYFIINIIGVILLYFGLKELQK
jgi:hypothetical protein